MRTTVQQAALLVLTGLLVALGIYGLSTGNTQNLRLVLAGLLAGSLVLAALVGFPLLSRLRPRTARPARVGASPGVEKEKPSSCAGPGPPGSASDPDNVGSDSAWTTGGRNMISRRIISALLEALEHPVFLVTASLRVEMLNAAAERADRDSTLGSPVTAELLERARRMIEEAGETSPPKLQDAFIWRVHGEPRYFLPRLLALRGLEPPKTIGVAVILEDVTQFRLIDELKSNFFSTVSHEIKTPLTSVRMAIHMLQAEMLGPLEPRQAALIKTAREDIERLLRLLSNLLDLARFENGAPQMDWETVPVRALVDEAMGEIQTLLVARNLTIEMVCPEGLPDLCIDRARIQHVLRNLLTNAIKHSREGSEIRLTVARTENGGVRFSVQDYGSGIEAEHLGRIFDKFYRVPGQKTHGSGLGLSIAREIILAHTGSINCESEPMKRTTFHFSLPTAAQLERRRTQPEQAD